MTVGDTAWSHFTIGNAGGSPLEFVVAIPSIGLPILTGNGGDGRVRVSLGTTGGTVPPGGQHEVGVRFDAREAIAGWPVGILVHVVGNDPARPDFDYHIHLTLRPAPAIPATLDVRPDEIVAGRGRPTITAAIELAPGFDPALGESGVRHPLGSDTPGPAGHPLETS